MTKYIVSDESYGEELITTKSYKKAIQEIKDEGENYLNQNHSNNPQNGDRNIHVWVIEVFENGELDHTETIQCETEFHNGIYNHKLDVQAY